MTIISYWKSRLPLLKKEDLREAVANWILFLYIVLLVTLLTVCIWVFYRSLRPLYALLNWLDSYLPGKQHGPVPNDTRIPEFRRLNEAAAQAVERSEQLFKQQKAIYRQCIARTSDTTCRLQQPYRMAARQYGTDGGTNGRTVQDQAYTELHRPAE